MPRPLSVLSLSFLLGCAPDCPEKCAPIDSTGKGDDSGTETGDSRDSDSGTDTGDSHDSDSGAETGDSHDSDSGTELPRTFDLGAVGIKLVGEEALDAYGIGGVDIAVAAAGDVDGDGHADLLVGLAGSGLGGGFESGAAWLVRGPLTTDLDLSLAHARFLGADEEHAGLSVASAGDTDGDGYDDVLVGAPGFADGSDLEGRAYLVRGPVEGDLPLSGADAILQGEYVPNDHDTSSGTGMSVACAGDVDGDGRPDLLVGAPGLGGGAAYLVLGPVTSRFDLATDADMRLTTNRSGSLGTGVASAGDTDGDGFDDILIGQPGHDTDVALLFLGPVTGERVPDDADATLTVRTDVPAGIGPRSAGDTDGDGYDDVLLDAPGDDDGGVDAGAAYVFRGPLAGPVETSEAAAKLVGPAEYAYAGSDVAGAGDVDGDGLADIIVGASDHGWTDGPGAAYVVFGPVFGVLALPDAGVTLRGEGDDRVGYAVAGAGDLDGDGRSDVIVGGPGDDDGGEDAGAAWLVFASTISP